MRERSVLFIAAAMGLLILCGEVAQSSVSVAGAEARGRVYRDHETTASEDCDQNVEQDPEQVRKDEDIRRAVLESLTKSHIEGVRVCIRCGIATLTGAVRRDQLVRAIRAAHEAEPKPKKVMNNLWAPKDE